MSKHTPGPWHYAECQMGVPFVDTESAGDLFAAVLPLDEERANVRMMAAAPDLLAACEAMVEARLLSEASFGTADTYSSAAAMALAAVAKARGET